MAAAAKRADRSRGLYYVRAAGASPHARAMKDYLVLAGLVVAFATLVTVHVFIAARLVLRARPRWRGGLALIVPPLAPIWAWREGWRRSAQLWVLAVVAYGVALLLS